MTNYNKRLDEVFDKMGYTKNTDFRKDAGRLITGWHNKQVEEVLDRLESTAAYGTDIEEYAEDVLSAIEVERNKLKEANQ